MSVKTLHVTTTHFYDSNDKQYRFDILRGGFIFPPGSYVEYINKLGEREIIGLEKTKFYSFIKCRPHKTHLLMIGVKYKKDRANIKNFTLLKNAKYLTK